VLTKETWLFINTFAPWVAAIGSIGAVIVALYLARRSDQLRLDVSAGVRMIVMGSGLHPQSEEVVSIRITNIGRREAEVVGLGWRIGIFRRRYLEQMPSFNPLEPPLPVRLRDGEEMFRRIPLSPTSLWLDDFIRTCLGKWPHLLEVKFIRVRVFTSVGRVFEACLEPGLQRKLLQHVEVPRAP